MSLKANKFLSHFCFFRNRCYR